MSVPETLVPLLGAISDFLAFLDAHRVRAILIGGVAVALLGRPRLTRDIDATALVDEEYWPALLRDLPRWRLVTRVSDALEFARRTRVLLLRHVPTGIEIDLTMAGIPFENEAIDRAQKVAIGGIGIPIPTPEDLIVMKAVAHRPRDLADIEGILQGQARIDRRRVRRLVRAFSIALDMPDILDDFEAVLARSRRRRG